MFRFHPSKLCVTAALITLAAQCRAYEVSIVVNRVDAKTRQALQRLEAAVSSGHHVEVFEMAAIPFGNPKEEGRRMAQIAAADLIVPVGGEASRFVVETLAQNKIFFVGATIVNGGSLESKRIGGLFAYSPEGWARAAKTISGEPSNLGLIYTPGFRPLAERLSLNSQNLGLKVFRQELRRKNEIVPAAMKILAQSSVFWVAGDTLLSGQLAFGYLASQALEMGIPVMAADRSLLSGGAFVVSDSDLPELADEAAPILSAFLSNGINYGEDRFFYPSKMRLKVNHKLASKMKIELPKGTSPVWIP
ncbi:MAG: hypothetical protein HY547_08995 [Elusimicrobia bacterium]|nr:hypothetical protein [Elusimicrobiota bacterium]